MTERYKKRVFSILYILYNNEKKPHTQTQNIILSKIGLFDKTLPMSFTSRGCVIFK